MSLAPSRRVRSCIQQSQTLFTGAAVRWLAYHPDEELQVRLDALELADLYVLSTKVIPLGALVLPSLALDPAPSPFASGRRNAVPVQAVHSIGLERCQPV
jgi:hypothetical protein